MVKLIVSFLLAAGSLTVYAQPDQERVVLSLSARKFVWLISKQTDSLDRILDARVQYVHSNGWTQNKREVLEDLRSGKLLYQRVDVKEASVRFYGKTAIVNGTGAFEGVNNGTPFKMDLRYTEVYVQSPSGWQLVSRHSNRMP